MEKSTFDLYVLKSMTVSSFETNFYNEPEFLVPITVDEDDSLLYAPLMEP